MSFQNEMMGQMQDRFVHFKVGKCKKVWVHVPKTFKLRLFNPFLFYYLTLLKLCDLIFTHAYKVI